MAACSKCGTEPPANARFCHGCGAPIARADAQAEYKQVTVLFADVVHSMDIAAAVGPERLREIMTQLVTRTSAVVQRYGGTVDKFTGDGIMALFGAPVALEDHALRACLTALGIQDATQRLAAELGGDVALSLRIGLNSGEVIAGEIGSGALGYTAIGEQVGIAQRMESVAPPGGVMVSESTARLVEGVTVLGQPQQVYVKGAVDALVGRQLLSVATDDERTEVPVSTLVGRGWEVTALAAMLDRSAAGRGSVVGISGPAGIGKTRLVRETVELARTRGLEVFSSFCESHATDVPFRVMERLLRSVTRTSGLADEAARLRVQEGMPEADPQDVWLLCDLLGVADPEVKLPKIDPDARRRRLTALFNAYLLARTDPAIFLVEDVHWIDEASESMLADLLTVVTQTPSIVLFTYRPEYQGALQLVTGAQTFALAPLTDSEASVLVCELLGRDPSVAAIADVIAARAAGNPLFAEEITRELAERGVLGGERGDYICHADVADIRVPPTLQATIAARIDRLSPAAKHTLSAAAIVGSRFTQDLLVSLGIDPSVDELLAAELVHQVRFTANAAYAFRHPLIRTVAYEAQLKADRARLHRRLAEAIEAREPHAVDQHAALIAEHLEAAGDGVAAYGWHMRAANWATNRDIASALLSWERAQKIADALPADVPHRMALRIAPRTMLCGVAWRVHADAGARFEELRELCSAAGDKASLAIAMAGMVIGLAYQARIREASQLASEAVALIEAVDDPTLTVGLSFASIYAKGESAEWSQVLQWSQRVIDLADGDPARGNFIVGSPLAIAHTTRAIACYCLGRAGWRADLRQGLDMARRADPLSYARAVAYGYFPAIPAGVLRPDVRAVREIEGALRIAERSGDDFALAFARMTLGVALVHRETATEYERGELLLTEVTELFQRQSHNLSELPIVNVYSARDRARRGERDDAIAELRAVVEHLVREGQLLTWGIPATAVLVETLLDRGAAGDVAEAAAALDRVVEHRPDQQLPVRDIWLLRMRALLARSTGRADEYARLADRYLEMAVALGFEGHIVWAEQMP
ncbi:adenylate/guanylate cyclase domain-containing protein [Mycobacterium sp. TY814]|uniref:adenylate/guanylate cyclase domain-containing protein n=1 Tax=unclassified Mycobacterium TaxID=2642494 RepID=UPI002741F3CE|nr:adenylate/guanylate cyclase domain-containing protein [Mycobacterium sp. TY814]MDP7725877.1 adenylate/guanylate cyclase domain-containing protein [Mycobacterium sp. TY814]